MDHYELVGSDTKVIKLSESKNSTEKKKYLEKTLPSVKMDTPKDAVGFLNNL
ncbi:MAG: hypothetical protein NTV02_00640 [Candidatus Zambryskibacteria bacterium]|nr:hypothetical protein [Candidatus Zambryskibacteria bacterium]